MAAPGCVLMWNRAIVLHCSVTNTCPVYGKLKIKCRHQKNGGERDLLGVCAAILKNSH